MGGLRCVVRYEREGKEDLIHQDSRLTDHQFEALLLRSIMNRLGERRHAMMESKNSTEREIYCQQWNTVHSHSISNFPLRSHLFKAKHPSVASISGMMHDVPPAVRDLRPEPERGALKVAVLKE